MKTKITWVLCTITVIVLLLIYNCNQQNVLNEVTLPFKAECIGEYKYMGPDTLQESKCSGSLSKWRAIVDAKGNSNPLGNIKVHFDFCGDSLSNYGNLFAYIIDKDGDTLFIDGSGHVYEGRLDEHPEYVTSYWRDTIRFIGGTGKFNGAKGFIISDDYNSSKDVFSHHHWTGNIILLKNNK